MTDSGPCPPRWTLDQWLAYLEKNHPVEIELGLARISAVLSRLDLPPIAGKVVIVAGTNGKGSCVRTLESLAIAAGVSVGTYTSPHLLRYNERVRLQGRDVADDLFCDAFERIDAARGDVSLTYFEVGTLAAFILMAEAQVELAVLEVGLGGRYDAVNVIDADVAVITPVAIDHAAWLGNDRETIAREKAGIVRSGNPVVCADDVPPSSLKTEFDRVGCPVFWIGEAFFGNAKAGELTVSLTGLDGGSINLSGLPVPVLPLPSVLAALQAWLLLGFSVPSGLGALLANLELPGRYQEYRARGRKIIVDVAHNPAAANFLAARLRSETAPRFCVFAVMADKDVSGLIAALEGVTDQWFVGDLENATRALPAVELEKLLYTHGCKVTRAASLMDAFADSLDSSPEGATIIVCGSFFTVAPVLTLLESGHVE